MWKIDSYGNAANEFGEWIFFTVSVLKQERGCGGRRHWLGDFKSTDDARDLRRIGEMAFLDPTAYLKLRAKYQAGKRLSRKKLAILELMRREQCKCEK